MSTTLRPSGRAEQRRKGFKKAIDADESRRKREDQMTQVRREKREESLQKKRFAADSSPGSPVSPSRASQSNANNNEKDELRLRRERQLRYIPTLIAALQIENASVSYRVEAVKQFRRMLSKEPDPPIDAVIQSGAVPYFIRFLQQQESAELQYESAWSLTNIASGSSEHTRIVVESGALPLFVKLLSMETNKSVREQAIWALGNIAGDSSEFRDSVIACEALDPLLHIIMSPSSSESMIRNGTWALSNLCRGKPSPEFDSIKRCFGCFLRLLSVEDTEVIMDACWALSFLTDECHSRAIRAVIDAGVVPRVVELLMHKDTKVVSPSLRIVGNIVAGDNDETQYVLNCHALGCLYHLIHNVPKKSILKEVVWILSNITAGNKQQIESVYRANLFPVIVRLLYRSEFDIKKEAAYAISNATSGGSHDHIKHLIYDCSCIEAMCPLLACHDSKVTTIVLQGLEHILKVGAAEAALSEDLCENACINLVEQCGGVDMLEQLLTATTNEEIYDRANDLLVTYIYPTEDMDAGLEEMDQNTMNQQQYSFGLADNDNRINFNF